MASLAGKATPEASFPCPHSPPDPRTTEASLTPAPTLLQLQLQRSGLRWGLFGSVFVWGGWVIAVLDYVFLATKQSCINFPWMMKFKESINRNTKQLVPIGSHRGLLPTTSELPSCVGSPTPTHLDRQSRTQRPRRVLWWQGGH